MMLDNDCKLGRCRCLSRNYCDAARARAEAGLVVLKPASSALLGVLHRTSRSRASACNCLRSERATVGRRIGFVQREGMKWQHLAGIHKNLDKEGEINYHLRGQVSNILISP